MDMQVVTESVQIGDLIRGGMTALATVVGIVSTALGGLLIWYIKLRIQRRYKKEDERGPVLYKNEHDKVAGEKHGEIMGSLQDISKAQTEGFEKVHGRIDAHLEAEASRG